MVPINYFIEKPFQNWTRVSADLLGTVFLPRQRAALEPASAAEHLTRSRAERARDGRGVDPDGVQA